MVLNTDPKKADADLDGSGGEVFVDWNAEEVPDETE